MISDEKHLKYEVKYVLNLFKKISLTIFSLHIQDKNIEIPGVKLVRLQVKMLLY